MENACLLWEQEAGGSNPSAPTIYINHLRFLEAVLLQSCQHYVSESRCLHGGQAGNRGVLHAKAVLADDEAAFVTSANLTEAALDRNIELGLLVRDRAQALSIRGYLQNLIDRSLLLALPSPSK